MKILLGYFNAKIGRELGMKICTKLVIIMVLD
jgi:hypothetical protein